MKKGREASQQKYGIPEKKVNQQTNSSAGKKDENVVTIIDSRLGDDKGIGNTIHKMDLQINERGPHNDVNRRSMPNFVDGRESKVTQSQADSWHMETWYNNIDTQRNLKDDIELTKKQKNDKIKMINGGESQDQFLPKKSAKCASAQICTLIAGLIFCVSLLVLILVLSVSSSDEQETIYKPAELKLENEPILVRPEDCIAPEYYIIASQQCELCETTQTSGYIKAFQSCETCLTGQYYDSTEQICKNLKPVYCTAPYYYMKARAQCELCETTETSGYIKQSQSCESCSEGQLYDSTSQLCYIPHNPIGCISPRYYIKASHSCERCELTMTSGYIQETQTCEVCPEGWKYSCHSFACYEPDNPEDCVAPEYYIEHTSLCEQCETTLTSGYIKETQSCGTCLEGQKYNQTSLQCYIPVKPEDCIAPEYYIRESEICELCESTKISGYIPETQSCVTCPEGQKYNSTSQICYVPVKPEDCIPPLYYFRASEICEPCEITKTSGYILETQSCETCPEGQKYNKTSQLCYVPVKPEDCIPPQYYIKESEICELCEIATSSGYILETQSCEICPEGQKYNQTSQLCYIPVDPNDCVPPQYYIKETELCEACETTKTSGYIFQTQSCETCPEGQKYNSTSQHCYVPVKPEDCIPPVYYIRESELCEPCKITKTSGYILETQSCETCPEGQKYNKTSQLCYIPVKPEDCIPPQYYIRESEICELCEITKTSGYILETQSCETCPEGQKYNSTSQLCYVPVKPEDCIPPEYYIRATEICEICEITDTSGYVLETQSCEQCPEGQRYNKTSQLCYVPVKPEDCIPPEYYIRATEICEVCEITNTSGYILETQTCETCPEGQKYNRTSQLCYIPVKPEDCIPPLYYIKATEICEKCESTKTSGYILETQSCETCPDGQKYNATTQLCYVPVKPEDCIPPEFYIRATEICEFCEITKTSGYILETQSCETCPAGQKYNATSQLCYVPVKPEDCITPFYYIQATEICEKCGPEPSRGYISATQSCYTCPEGGFYDPVEERCYQCTGQFYVQDDGFCGPCPEDTINVKGDNICVSTIVLKPEDCIAPEYYLKEFETCGTCEFTQSRGYIKADQECKKCPDGEFYDTSQLACFTCTGESRFLDENNQCSFCPEAQVNQGDNKCINRCTMDEHWNGQECKLKANFLNLCRSSGFIVRKETAEDNPFEDQCDHPCHRLEVHMRLNAPQDQNPYFPIAVSCIGDRPTDVRSHGEPTSDSVMVTVGSEDACIYRVERQGSSQAITAMRYYWYHGDKYGQATVGNYLYGASAVSESFNGCLHGLFGNYKTDESHEKDLGFRYSYTNPFQCATDDPSTDTACLCFGLVHYGPLYGHDPARGALSFVQMKNWYPQYKTVNADVLPTNTVACTAETFGVTKQKEEVYQCQCEEL